MSKWLLQDSLFRTVKTLMDSVLSNKGFSRMSRMPAVLARARRPGSCMAGEKDRGQADVPAPKLAHKLEAIDKRDLVVQYDAAGTRQVGIRQKFDPFTVGMNDKSLELQRELECRADRCVAIKD